MLARSLSAAYVVITLAAMLVGSNFTCLMELPETASSFNLNNDILAITTMWGTADLTSTLAVINKS